LLVARTGGSIESFIADATMIGLAPNLEAAGSVAHLRTGEHFFTFTDGLYSLRLPSGERMTWQQPAQAVASSDRQTNFLASVLQRIKALGAEGPFDDDITAISAGYRV
jgi:hypothetical protein